MAVGPSWCVLVVAMATVAVHCSDMQDPDVGRLLQDDTILPAAAQSTDELMSAVVAYLIEQHDKKQEQEQEEFIKALIELTKFQTLDSDVDSAAASGYDVMSASAPDVESVPVTRRSTALQPGGFSPSRGRRQAAVDRRGLRQLRGLAEEIRRLNVPRDRRQPEVKLSALGPPPSGFSLARGKRSLSVLMHKLRSHLSY